MGKTVKTIKVKYSNQVMERLKIHSLGDWIDLRASEDIHLKAGEYRAIPLGVAMELPEGYEALVVPRSSTFNNWGVLQANSIGIIDETYCGDNDEWHFLVYATRDTVIRMNDRICQFRIIKHQPVIEFKETESLCNRDREGFGMTGIR